jgi:Lrp/AsnC family transcriptional regulator, leucine-responsive regulatory protein
VRDHNHLRRFLLERAWQVQGVQRTETFLPLAELTGKDLTTSLLGSSGPGSVDDRSRRGLEMQT